MNLTPHRLRVLDADDAVILDLPAPAAPARISQTTIDEQPLHAVALRTIAYGTPQSLPAALPNVLLVVSRVVASEVPRADLLFPDDEVRDDQNRIIACRALARFHRTPP